MLYTSVHELWSEFWVKYCITGPTKIRRAIFVVYVSQSPHQGHPQNDTWCTYPCGRIHTVSALPGDHFLAVCAHIELLNCERAPFYQKSSESKLWESYHPFHILANTAVSILCHGQRFESNAAFLSCWGCSVRYVRSHDLLCHPH